MKTIQSLDAQARWSELLDRTEHGETFEIMRNGHPAGRLTPPDARRDPAVVAAAVERLKAMAGFGGTMSFDELKAMIHEGHRY